MHQCPCEHICASRVPIFQGLTLEELTRFNDILTTTDYAAGEIIYNQGYPAHSLCIVNTGSVKLFKTSPDGREQVLRILSLGDFFGEVVLFGEQTLATSAQALECTKICRIDKRQAEDIIHRNPGIAHKLIAALNLRLLQAEEQIEFLATRSSLQRVTRLLLTLSRDQGTNEIILPLNREGLANLTGMTFENFSRKLSELQQLGLITPQGRRKMILHDTNKLQELS
ncbi:MAG: CRP/FNR family transcriptional regulator anaerobic regulatory protein [Bacillota bacterium]|nr:MAG: CRP/FNR family transcriptional regulator anaerobic regulatory protein [Bacillota bacterium]MBS3949655.1 Crp/Fnr family transcriptional regulator [Peptococcaceae bacterium]